MCGSNSKTCRKKGGMDLINDNREQAMDLTEQVVIKVSRISIITNLILSVFKMVSGIVASSGAMISDAVHLSLIHI